MKVKVATSVENTLHNENLVNTILLNVNDISQNSHLMKQQIDTFIETVKNVSNNMAGIAEKTNLLALNAFIEAARTGKAGARFCGSR